MAALVGRFKALKLGRGGELCLSRFAPAKGPAVALRRITMYRCVVHAPAPQCHAHMVMQCRVLRISAQPGAGTPGGSGMLALVELLLSDARSRSAGAARS